MPISRPRSRKGARCRSTASQEVARGRVWTGADALERGLVDELGGFWTAVDDVKMLAGIDADTRVRFKTYPASEGFFGTVSRLLETSSASLKALQGLHALMESRAGARADGGAPRDAERPHRVFGGRLAGPVSERTLVLLDWPVSNIHGWGILGLNLFMAWAHDRDLQPLMGAPITEHALTGYPTRPGCSRWKRRL